MLPTRQAWPEYSRRLRKAREARGMGVVEVSRLMGWDHSQLSRLESGLIGCSVRDARLLAYILGVPLCLLTDGESCTFSDRP